MKILLGYNYFPHPVDVRMRTEAWLARLRGRGFEIDGVPISLNPPSQAMCWQEIDQRWQSGDKELFAFYEALARAMEGYDVFVNCNGVNLHPEFVRELPLFKVYACFDDPESSDWLSRPVAPAYDLAMVGNIACVETYREWGVPEAVWWPIGFHPNDFDPGLTKERILTGERDINLALLCERTSDWRKVKLDAFTAAFPDEVYYGRGWPAGFLPEDQRVPLLQRTKLGPNFHNSTGPVNSRTYVLPANGVMMLCDNKDHLASIYDLGKEAVGFSSTAEAIDLCRYYLAHDQERREIAAAGWERVTRDYNEGSVFNVLVKSVEKSMVGMNRRTFPPAEVIAVIRTKRTKILMRNVARRCYSRLVNLIFRWRRQ